MTDSPDSKCCTVKYNHFATYSNDPNESTRSRVARLVSTKRVGAGVIRRINPVRPVPALTNGVIR
jgi:hypothetical protein